MLNQISGFDAGGLRHPRKKTYGVKVGHVQVGGGAPIVVQSMTNTDTADVETTYQQTLELAEAGSEIVRWTVNVPEAAAAVPVIKKRLLDAGCRVPIIGDFHYNGHVLLTKYPECAAALDKYRINPGNVGAGQRRDEQFSTICKVAVDHGKPVRIGVNGGSLNQELVMQKMQENTDKNLGKESEEIINGCMVQSALQSTELALECGLRNDQIIFAPSRMMVGGVDGGVVRRLEGKRLSRLQILPLPSQRHAQARSRRPGPKRNQQHGRARSQPDGRLSPCARW
jgi:(E)-4-hydroxy-3-methylbut-2-enyl-diphosphate synthase